MKTIACVILFAALWHTPPALFDGFTDRAKVFVTVCCLLAFAATLLGLILEDNPR